MARGMWPNHGSGKGGLSRPPRNDGMSFGIAVRGIQGPNYSGARDNLSQYLSRMGCAYMETIVLVSER
jgi:hypothetical protein